MTERLKSELAKLGEAAPQLHVPDDTWRRGRRSLRRIQTVIAVGVLALVAGGLVGVGLLLDSSRLPTPADLIPKDSATKVVPAPLGVGAYLAR